MRLLTRVRELAEQTPSERNRYVDLLRTVSILMVVVGHWTIETLWVKDGELIRIYLLRGSPDVQLMTWLFQVMTVFFIVGGYANAASLQTMVRTGQSPAGWLNARLTRLAVPVVVLILVWAVIALAMQMLQVDSAAIQYMSQASLGPTWFLAIYILVVLLAPLTWRFWQWAGYGSIVAFAALAIAMDVLFFVFDLRVLGWSNYFWVWLAVHQLGYAWRAGRLPVVPLRLLISAVGAAALWLMVFKGPYPLAMAGSPEDGPSNTLPPKVTLIALGLAQFGLLTALEAPFQRALNNLRLWTFIVMINAMIMTIYLWHLTVLMLFGGLLYLAGGLGLGLEPGTLGWWLSRPLWWTILGLLLLPLALLLSPLERGGYPSSAPVPGMLRQVTGATALCIGIALLAAFGFGDQPKEWVDRAAIALALAGALTAGIYRRPAQMRSVREG